MEILYDNNLFVIFIVAGFTIFNINHLSEYQRIILYYLLMFAVSAFGTMRMMFMLPLSFGLLFVFLEYFSLDKMKMELLLKFRYKLMDFFYQIFFVYHFASIVICFILLYISHIAQGALSISFLCLSIASFAFALHQISKRKFEVKTFTEMFEIMAEHTFYSVKYDNELAKRFNILTFVEDHTYFDRENTYNFLSVQFVKIKLLQLFELIKGKTAKQAFAGCKSFIRKSVTVRGYSTLEMQLIRNIAIINGYDECVIRRKIFELVYSTIFFSSLKDYYAKTTRLGMNHYKEYLLYVYCHNVLSKIGNQMKVFSEFFDEYDMSKWPLEKMLVVCVGLSFRKVTTRNIDNYEYIIDIYNMDKRKILYSFVKN